MHPCRYAQQAQHIAKVLSDGHEMPQRIVSVQTRIEGAKSTSLLGNARGVHREYGHAS